MSQVSHPHSIGQNRSHSQNSCKRVWKMYPGAKQNGFIEQQCNHYHNSAQPITN